MGNSKRFTVYLPGAIRDVPSENVIALQYEPVLALAYRDASTGEVVRVFGAVVEVRETESPIHVSTVQVRG